MNLKNKLTGLVGKPLLYHTHEIRLDGFKITTETVELINGEEIISIPKAKAAKEIAALLPVEKEVTVVLRTLPSAKQMTDLKNLVLENIEQIKTDKAAISRAKAINESINTLLGMAKLELQVIRMQKRS